MYNKNRTWKPLDSYYVKLRIDEILKFDTALLRIHAILCSKMAKSKRGISILNCKIISGYYARVCCVESHGNGTVAKL